MGSWARQVCTKLHALILLGAIGFCCCIWLATNLNDAVFEWTHFWSILHLCRQAHARWKLFHEQLQQRQRHNITGKGLKTFDKAFADCHIQQRVYNKNLVSKGVFAECLHSVKTKMKKPKKIGNFFQGELNQTSLTNTLLLIHYSTPSFVSIFRFGSSYIIPNHM